MDKNIQQDPSIYH